MDSSLLVHRDSRDICCAAVVDGLIAAYTLFSTPDQAPTCIKNGAYRWHAPRPCTRCAQRYRRTCLLSVDVQTATLRECTVKGGIRTRNVIVIVKVGHNRKRACLGLRGRQCEGNGGIAGGAGQGASSIVREIREGELPGPTHICPGLGERKE